MVVITRHYLKSLMTITCSIRINIWNSLKTWHSINLNPYKININSKILEVFQNCMLMLTFFYLKKNKTIFLLLKVTTESAFLWAFNHQLICTFISLDYRINRNPLKHQINCTENKTFQRHAYMSYEESNQKKQNQDNDCLIDCHCH